MKEETVIVRVKRYSDDEGNPVCGECEIFNKYICEYSDKKSTATIFEILPSTNCPIWNTKLSPSR